MAFLEKIFKEIVNRQTDVLRRGTCGVELFLFNATPPVDFLTPLIPSSKPIPTRWTECNPIQTKFTLTLTPQCPHPKGGQTDDVQ